MAIDLKPLWNFGDPAGSEARFRSALATATGDDVLILHTQIARSYGLRGEFDRARTALLTLEPQLEGVGAEARARFWLELGRTYASAAHGPESQTADAKAAARHAYEQALATANGGRLDHLAIDALHMLAFVDTDAADQLKWGREALAVAQQSQQAPARAWEPSLRNNIGYALHALGRHDEALSEFRQALLLRERGTDEEAIRIARWMIAWTLRAMNRIDEALDIQLRLERERELAGKPSPYVFEELELLHRAKGDEARARHYAELKASTGNGE